MDCRFCKKGMELFDDDGTMKIYYCECSAECIIDSQGNEEWEVPFGYVEDKRIREIRQMKTGVAKAVFGYISIRTIPEEVIKKYNLKIGDITPFGSQMIVDQAV